MQNSQSLKMVLTFEMFSKSLLLLQQKSVKNIITMNALLVAKLKYVKYELIFIFCPFIY